MRNQVLILFSVISLLISDMLLSQDIPKASDSLEYKQAYELLFDSQTRAKKALDILTKSGSIAPTEIKDQELLLMYYAYNELYIPEKQLEIASILYSRSPDSRTAIGCICNAMHFKLDTPEGIVEVEKFVDEALRKNVGNRRSFLVLKANAIVAKRDIADGKKRLEVTDTLVEAYASDPSPKNEVNLSIGEATNFIVDEYPFVSFFSQSERQTIKERMLKARKEKETSEARASGG